MLRRRLSRCGHVAAIHPFDGARAIRPASRRQPAASQLILHGKVTRTGYVNLEELAAASFRMSS